MRTTHHSPLTTHHSPQAGYRIDRQLASTPWSCLYAARKVFLNYRYDDRRLYEAGEDEWAQVLIRACPDAASAGIADFTRSCELLKYEAAQVLGRNRPWLPEPLDWLEGEQAALVSGGEFEPSGGPLLVIAVPQGQPLATWLADQPFGSPARLQVTLEALELLASLHEHGQVAGGLGPDDFLVGEGDRLFFMATDRVVPADRSRELRPCFPPARFPHGFSPPEALDPDGGLAEPGDLYAWAALCLYVLAEIDPADAAHPAGGVEWKGEYEDRLQAAIAEAARAEPDLVCALSSRRRERTEAMVPVWADCIRRCLSPAPDDRPASVRDLRENHARPPAFLWFRRLWNLARPRLI